MTSALPRIPRAPGPASPARVGRVLLSWIETWWEERADPADPDAPQPLPEARYLAAGDPRTVAWDHDEGQLTVAMDRVLTGLDATAPAGAVRGPRRPPGNAGNVVQNAVYEVQLVRPAPGLDFSGRIPSGTAIDAHGYLAMADQGHLIRCLHDGIVAGAFLREHVGQGGIILGDGESLGPSGGLAAAATGITIPLL